MKKTDRDYLICEAFLRTITGNSNSIAIGDEGGEVFQIMPDESHDQDFFDWYCGEFPDAQFFSNIYEAVVRYTLIKKIYDTGYRSKDAYSKFLAE